MQELEKEILYLVIDPSTGEIVNELNPGDKIKHKSSADSQRRIPNQYELDFNGKESFVKLYPEVVSVLFNKLTGSEFALAITLSKFVSYGNCMLQVGGNNYGSSLTVKEISDLLNRDYGNFKKTFRSLINKGVIGKFSFETGDVKTNETKRISGYFVNPYIYSRGKIVNKTVLKLFADTGWKELIKG